MILNEAEAKGASIQDLLDLLTRMEADFWRLPAIQKIHNAQLCLRMIDAGVRVVVPGTETRITREGERAAVSLAIAEARRRIGNAVQDLEAKLAEMFTPAEGGEDQ